MRAGSVYFGPVNAEFDWWLLFVGIAVGAGLVWFVLADSRRHQEEIEADEVPREALWLSTTLAEDGWDVPPEAVERLLRAAARLPGGATAGPDAGAAAPADVSLPDPGARGADAPRAGVRSRRADHAAARVIARAQSSPARTGGDGADGLPAVVSDTPNCAPSSTPAIDGAGPTQ